MSKVEAKKPTLKDILKPRPIYANFLISPLKRITDIATHAVIVIVIESGE